MVSNDPAKRTSIDICGGDFCSHNIPTLDRGYVSTSEVGLVIIGILAAGILTVLWYGLKDRIEQWLKRTQNSEVSLQSISENNDQANLKEELNLLIKPLYCEFDKYQDMPNEFQRSLIHPYHGLALALSTIKWFDPNSEYAKSYGADKVDYVLDVLKRHGDLAQPELKRLIVQYFEIRQKRRESTLTSDQDFQKTYDIVSQIDTLVKVRYNELMWGDAGITRTERDAEYKRALNKEELAMLIKPLYLKFDKYSPRNGSSSSLIHQLSSPQELWNTPISKTSGLKEIVEDANVVIDVMEQHRELAQPLLKDTIDRYLGIRRLHKENLHTEGIASYGKNSEIRYYSEATKVLKELDNLIKARYKELTNTK